MTPNDQDFERPSPQALLEQAQSEARGKLKIFLGAAPGVGKTYAMLKSAHERKADGVDVVVGLVETHGRADTQQLVDGLDVLPRLKIPYKGHELTEMDLDAILTRRPALVLVDELAHTNAPGCRHPKRYQDIEEILAHGIDVFTTLNVQHVESLNDVVAQITRVRVREIVPDSILEQAEITLVDLAPDELIERLNDGKVYVPEQAQKAVQHFFAPGNLTALRELALRVTAQRVDEQMLSYMQAHAIKGPWPAGDRVMVCISDNPVSSKLVRLTKRAADRLNAPWVAVYVETQKHYSLSETERDRIKDALQLTERLGGEVVRLNGVSISEEIVKYATQNNVTRIVLAATRRSVWIERLFGTIVSDIIRKVDGIDVMVVTGDDTSAPSPSISVQKRKKSSLAQNVYTPYISTLLWVFAVTVVNQFLSQTVVHKNVLMLYLVPVLISAVSYGLKPSLLASFLCLLIYRLHFSDYVGTGANLPTFSDFVAMLMFLFVSVLASNLASRVRMQAAIATKRERMTAALYNFSRKLAGIGSLHDLSQAVVFHICSIMKTKICMLLPQDGRLKPRSAWPRDFTLNDGELSAAQWCFDHGKWAGRDTDTLPSMDKLFIPLNTVSGTMGVLALLPDDDAIITQSDERRLLLSMADQAAIAIERMEYSINTAKSQIKKLTERVETKSDQ